MAPETIDLLIDLSMHDFCSFHASVEMYDSSKEAPCDEDAIMTTATVESSAMMPRAEEGPPQSQPHRDPPNQVRFVHAIEFDSSIATRGFNLTFVFNDSFFTRDL